MRKPIPGTGRLIVPIRRMTVLGMLLALMFIAGLLVGSIPVREVLQTLIGAGSKEARLIVFEFRMPRVVLAGLIGAGLAVSGTILQGITRNVLAEPGILGIHAGAGLAIAIGSIGFAQITVQSIYTMPLLAFAGGLAAGLATYVLAKKDGEISPIRMVLVGIGIGMLCSACLMLLQLRMDRFLFQSTAVWLAGTLSGATWERTAVLLPWLAVLLPASVAASRYFGLMRFEDPVAVGLGGSVQRQRLMWLAISVMLASACVSVGGGIAFLGLLAPHLAGKLIGRTPGVWLIASALMGSALLMAADLLARLLMPSGALPTGVVVSIIGAPYFLYILSRSK